MNSRRLLIDADNSNLKWVVVEAGQWRTQGRCDYMDWSSLGDELYVGTECFIASVTKPEREQQLAALLAEAGITPIWLKSEAAFEDLRNAYLSPAQLGVDRWMGLIAARQRTRDPVLVVSVGTAMTVDALAADGVFLRGVIVPGVTLMRQALSQGTAQVADTAGEWTAFPRNTADAVQSGIVAALCGAIQQQHARLAESAGVMPICLLTGGAAEVVSPHLSVPAEHVASLVLEGIDCIAKGTLSQ